VTGGCRFPDVRKNTNLLINLYIVIKYKIVDDKNNHIKTVANWKISII